MCVHVHVCLSGCSCLCVCAQVFCGGVHIYTCSCVSEFVCAQVCAPMCCEHALMSVNTCVHVHVLCTRLCAVCLRAHICVCSQMCVLPCNPLFRRPCSFPSAEPGRLFPPRLPPSDHQPLASPPPINLHSSQEARASSGELARPHHGLQASPETVCAGWSRWEPLVTRTRAL